MPLFDRLNSKGASSARSIALWAAILLLLAAPGAALSSGNAPASRPNADEPVVAAAADLKFALDEIALAFKRDTGKSVKLIFGSSGTFAAQIRNGAPFQLYLSADEKYVTDLHADGFTRDTGALYALGRIVLIAPSSSSLPVDPTLQGVAARLAKGGIKRFAIANPEHAPYGRCAEEALRKAGLWTRIRSKLVLGENVAQAAQFATCGSAEGGIVALSLAKSPRLAKSATYAVIPTQWHSPLRQRMVLLKNAGPTAHSFYSYLQTPAARAVMRRYGFELPGEVK
ncbi:molybdate ABC transporter substrate-binding protein [Geomonas oryzisoli]|uniref:Molybdate ABC transporter substrate-binding protein n=1 Tax=Geomonas oryzisoli TaxID=2847992 RepID=A0ABX8JGU3_9BACT|nr:molybdate ABC transporter substrate-binding protein [Geomonas oryzisoli]QWV94725.1 molybdate ABC transporter substrate-binding protein [Geomonas oryzisoli]